MDRFFSPLSLGALQLKHRIVMAPLTRERAYDDLSPHANSVTYYAQRATPGGLIITEAVPISAETPYNYAPGIFTDEQEAGWKRIVDAVHAKGGLISMQLWHIGRVAHPSWSELPVIKANGGKPGVSASDIPIPRGTVQHFNGEQVPPVKPRPLETFEIPRLVEDYRRAAVRAKRAGFDAVEVHAAHGYLINQFLCDGTNKRTDRYGGSVENRMRLMHEVVQTVIEVFGASRVGIRLSPTYKEEGGHLYYFTDDSNPALLYRSAIRSLDQYGLAYLLLSEPRWSGGKKNWDPATDTGFLEPLRNVWARSIYSHPLILAGGFTPKSAAEALKNNACDAVAFGRWFISNPDLVERLRTGAPLNVYDRTLFYNRDPVKGYIDYPALNRAETPLARDYATMRQEDIGTTLASAKSSAKL